MTKANTFQISISNCRNITALEDGPLTITHHHMHLYLAKNGTGKTTISKALRYCADKSPESYNELKSFSYLQTENAAIKPLLRCSPRIKSTAVFDSDWIDDHCFSDSSIHENAFELYVSDNDIRKKMKERDNILGRLKKLLSHDQVDTFIKQLKDINKRIGTPAKGAFRATAPCIKALRGGVPIHSDASFLQPITKSMTLSEQAKWLAWHTDRPIMHDESICPYCGTRDSTLMGECRDYDETREPARVISWLNLAKLYDDLKEEFSIGIRSRLRKILTSKNEPSEDEYDFLAQIVENNNKMIAAIESIRKAIDDDSFLNGSALATELKVHLATLGSFKLFLKTKGGSKTAQASVLQQLTTSLQNVIQAENKLTDASDALTQKTAVNIAKHKDELNTFLSQCGYSYQIAIEQNISTAHASVLLEPIPAIQFDNHTPIRNTGEALSFGERNALSLALFMIECIRDKPALIVLDDPISSFDSDKRFGVLYALFSKQANLFEENFSGKTTLVLTHDYLVATDLIAIHGNNFKLCDGYYLNCDKDGIIHLSRITNEAIRPYTQMLYTRINASSLYSTDTLCLIYIRQLCEMLRKGPGDFKTRYGITFSLLSDVLHGKSRGEVMRFHNWKNPNTTTVKTCENLVSQLLGRSFDFWQTLDTHCRNTSILVNEFKKPEYSNYEHLQLARWIIDRSGYDISKEKIMARFADETCHIGGEYLYQLDPTTFDQTPFYIVEWCEEIVDTIVPDDL